MPQSVCEPARLAAVTEYWLAMSVKMSAACLSLVDRARRLQRAAWSAPGVTNVENDLVVTA